MTTLGCKLKMIENILKERPIMYKMNVCIDEVITDKLNPKMLVVESTIRTSKKCKKEQKLAFETFHKGEHRKGD